MKTYWSLFLIAVFIGCATAKGRIKATAPNTEVVEAEGSAPIVNGDLPGAKKASLDDALKNALGLVIGVYVSQEALVSKALLIEDNILSQTQGYIEKYAVLGESSDKDFYRTRVKALVRKEDLSAKLKALDLEPKKLGNPVVQIAVEEIVDGLPASVRSAENELKKRFVEEGFTVSDSSAADIRINGTAESSFNTGEGLGGFVSYRAVLSLSAAKATSSDVIATVRESAGGVDVTREAAARAAAVNAAKKAKGLPADVLAYLRKRAVIQLTLSNVESINRLNDFMRSLRALIEVRDCRVRTFSNGDASLDLDMQRGTSSDIARRLEQMDAVKIKIKKTNAYDIQAELLK